MLHDEGYWLGMFERFAAWWQHSGDPSDPHVVLTSGNHSNGCFNATPLLENPGARRLIALELRLRYLEPLPDFYRFVGSAYGAILLVAELSSQLGRLAGFTEPQTDEAKSMLLKRFLVAGQKNLIVEDTISTGGTTRKTLRETKIKGGMIVSPILAIVNRSGENEIDGVPIAALINRRLPIWTPKECELCAAGSPAIAAKGNWWQTLKRRN